MKPEIKVVIYEEKNILQKLLELLDKQYEILLQKDIVEIDKIASQLEETSKSLANLELKRRSFINKEESFKDIIEKCEDEHIKQTYKEIKSLLHMIELQKETNTLFIKQQIIFNQKMLNAIRPSKNIGTYNSYGQIQK